MRINASVKVGSIIAIAGLAVALNLVLFLSRSRLSDVSFASPTDMTITANTTWSSDTTISGTLKITNNAVLTIDSATAGKQIVITANDIVVDSGASISADGKGYAGVYQSNGLGLGFGYGSSGYDGAGGAGYGGGGGRGYNLQGGVSYGSFISPVDLGSSGGGTFERVGAFGGGAIKLKVSGTLTVNGTISANGDNGVVTTDGASGGGSGGSVWFDVGTLAGSGVVCANGGNGVAGSGGGGGGGRIAIYSLNNSGYTGTISAAGGAGYQAGGVGTIYTFSGFTLYGNTSGSQDYITSQDNGLVKANITLSDNVSTILDVQFSEDGVSWGIYDGSSANNTTGGATWTAGTYTTVTGITSTPSQKTITSIWKFTTDGVKTLYVRAKGIIPNTIVISNTGSALTAYQVLVTLDTASLISAGKMKADCGDIRFVDSDRVTLLTYWIESGRNTTSTKIWVKVPSIPAFSIKIIYIYYGNSSASSVSNYLNTGDGVDGDINLFPGSAVTYNVNTTANWPGSPVNAPAVNFTVTENRLANTDAIVIDSSTAAGLLADDEILIINLRGTSGDYSDVGKYETVRIQSIVANTPSGKSTLTLTSYLKNSYNGTTQKVMVQRIPNWANVTIDSNATLTTDGWNGTKGGVLFFRASGTVTVSGAIKVNNCGFRSGTGVYGGDNYQGESIIGLGAHSLSASAGGGGGRGILCGNSRTSGGGGGSYATAGNTGGLEGSCSRASGGSYIYGDSQLSRLYFGAGGGAGYSGSSPYHAGGIIGIFANTLTNSGTIKADGTSGLGGGNDPAGSGAGGSILIEANAITTGTINAVGGLGFSWYNGQVGNNTGKGGDGRIAVYYFSSLSGSTNPAAYTATIGPLSQDSVLPEPSVELLGDESSGEVNDTIILDTVKPQVNSINIDQAYINSSNQTALSFTFIAAEAGTTYSYSIDDTDPVTSAVRSSGIIGTPTDTISNIDVHLLNDDNLTLTVYLKDNAGNQGSNVFDTVVKDVAAPSFTIGYYTDFACSNIFGGSALPVGTYYIKFTANESLDGVPLININAEGEANDVFDAPAMELSGNNYVYEHQIEYDPAAIGEVAEGIQVTATDRYDNTAVNVDVEGEKYTDTVAGGSFTISYYTDAACQTSLSGSYMIAGTYYIKISSEEEEALSGEPTVDIDAEGNANDVSDRAAALLSGNDYVYTRTIVYDALAVGETPEHITISALDWAGNPANGIEVSGEKYTDTVGPAFTIGYYTNIGCTIPVTVEYLAAGKYYIKLSAKEALTGNPVINIVAEGSSNDVSAGATAKITGNDYMYARIVLYNAAAVGSVAEVITVTATDTKGNASTNVNVSGEKYIDTVKPQVNSINIDQAYINRSNQTALAWTMNNTEAEVTCYYAIDDTAPATPAVSASKVLTAVEETVAAIDVSALLDGPLTLSVYLKDRAGNTGSTVTDTVSKDTAVPGLNPVSISSSNADTFLAKAGDTVTLRFTASEALSGLSAVTIAGNSAEIVNAAGYNYTASYIMQGADDEGEVYFTIDFSDAAGNEGEQVIATTDGSRVNFDGTLPVMTAVTIISNNAKNTALAKPQDTVTLTMTARELLSAAPAVTIGGNPADSIVSVSGNTYKAARVLQPGDYEGEVSFTIDFSDAVGNEGEQMILTTDSSRVIFDETAPSGYSVSIDQAEINNANQGTMSLTFAGAEVGAEYSCSITDINSTAVERGGTVLKADEQITDINVAGLEDGTLTLTVYLTDPAGNKGGDVSDTVVKDTSIEYYLVSVTSDKQTAGMGWTETVTAYDDNNNIVSGDSVTQITMSSSGNALFYRDNTYIEEADTYTLSSGTVTIYIKDTAAEEDITLTASDGNNFGTSAPFTIEPGPAKKLAFIQEPALTAVAGTALAPLPIVEIRDAFDNRCDIGADAFLTVTLAAVHSLDGVTVLSGTLNNSSVSAVDGVAAFAALSYTQAESIKLRASCGSLAADVSWQPTVVSPGSLIAVNVEPVSFVPNAYGSVAVRFTTVNPVPDDAVIEVVFPDSLGAGFTLNYPAATAASSTTMDGTLSVVTNLTTVTITRAGTAAQQPAGEEEVIILTNIKNPDVGGDTGSYQIKTQSAARADIDVDLAVSSDTIGGFSFTAPTAGTVWAAGSQDNAVTWAISGEVTNYLWIEYFNGEVWQTVRNNGQEAISSALVSPQLWDIPADARISSGYRMRITDRGQDKKFNTADDIASLSSVFSVSGGIVLNSPAAGEKISLIAPYDIRWVKSGTFDTKIEYSLDSGQNYNAVIGAGSDDNGITGTSFSWTPSADLSAGSTSVRIRVSDASTTNPPGSDESGGDFTVASLSVGELAGVVSDRAAVLSSVNIPWTSVGIENVQLEYYSNTSGRYEPIPGADALSAADSVFSWTVPDDVGSGVTVRATAVGQDGNQDSAITGLLQDISSAFTIYGALNLTAPAGGESYGSTAAVAITFSGSSSIDSVKFYYKTGLMTEWIEMTDAVDYTYSDGIGVGEWTPGFSDSSVWLRIEDAADSAVFDETSNYFTLSGVGIDSALIAGSPYTVGDTVNIFGTAVVSGNVKLEYSTTGIDGKDVSLGAGAANVSVNKVSESFNYAWTVPDAISTQVFVKVTDLNSSAYASVGPIVIQGQLTSVEISAPVNGVFYTVGEPAVISWDTKGTINAVKIEYYSSSYEEAEAPDIAESVSGSSYNWVVPDDINTAVRIRVSDAVVGHPLVWQDSDAFDIKGKIEGVIIDTADVRVNNAMDFRWNVRGNIGDVKVLYAYCVSENGTYSVYSDANAVTASVDCGWTPGQGTAAQEKSFTWLKTADGVAALGDPQSDPDVWVKLRVEDADDSLVYVESLPFEVKYQKIKWRAIDMNANPVVGLNVEELAVEVPRKPLWKVDDSSISGNNTVRYYPYNGDDTSDEVYYTLFSRLDGGVIYSQGTEWRADSDKTIVLIIETAATAATSYNVSIDAKYDAEDDAIDMAVWMTKKGLLVEKDSNPDTSDITSVKVDIYDSNGNQLNSADLGTGIIANNQGIFSGIMYDPAEGLSPEQTYTIKATITHLGNTYTGATATVVPSIYTYQAFIGAIYSASIDAAVISVWLERSGSIVDMPGDLILEVYKGDGTRVFGPVNYDGYDDAADALVSGFLHGGVYSDLAWDPIEGIENDVMYYVKAQISYRSKSYQAITPFSKSELSTIASDIVEMTDKVDAIDSLVSSVDTKVSRIDTAVEGVGSKVDTVTAKVDTVKTAVEAVDETADKILTATEELPEKIAAIEETVVEEIMPQVRSKILNKETQVKIGEVLTVRYQIGVGLSPVIDIYNSQYIKMIPAAAMTATMVSEVYEYGVEFLTSWGTGEFTIVCSEYTVDVKDSYAITVVRHDIDDVGSRTAAIFGTTARLSKISGIIDTLSQQVTLVETTLFKIGKDLKTYSGESEYVAQDIRYVHKQLGSLGEQIKKLGAFDEEKIDKMCEISQDKKEDIVYLKNKTEQIKAAMDMSTKLIDNVANKPVTQIWYEFR